MPGRIVVLCDSSGIDEKFTLELTVAVDSIQKNGNDSSEPDSKVIQQHAAKAAETLNRGEGHIHAAREYWQLSPVYRRLHPGSWFLSVARFQSRSELARFDGEAALRTGISGVLG